MVAVGIDIKVGLVAIAEPEFNVFVNDRIQKIYPDSIAVSLFVNAI